MNVETNLPVIDDILDEWRDALGTQFNGYRNHVYRMVNFTLALGEFPETARQKIFIAGAFHDLGIWPEGSFDYLAPSISRAVEYLTHHQLSAFSDDVTAMIGRHHKLTSVRDDPLVESFRRGDLADFSLGLIRTGISAAYVRDVKTAFPNEGFHRNLVKIAARWICRHPLNPAPVVRW